jgi:hypothetical protein
MRSRPAGAVPLTLRLPVLVLVLLLTTRSAAAQDAVTRRYLPNPADEDWTFLATAPDVDPWDPVKYMPLGKDGWFATLSGEVRYRPEGFRIRPAETRPSTVDNYLLQRYLFGSDFHFGARSRVFVEIQSGIINGSIRSPRATDQNRVDLHQAFYGWQFTRSNGHRLAIDVGRQELAVGSTRLISASPGLNVKRSFDGVDVSYRSPAWTVAGAFARLVAVDAGIFDDRSSVHLPFWGVAASRRSPRFARGELGGYYLGIDRPQSLYQQGVGHERRHTVGLKWTGAGTRGDQNYDALFQWGRFADGGIADGGIRAWAFATESGYRLALTGWKPRVSLRADFASGDRDAADPGLNAFNPLFPGNSYSGAVGLFGPTNLTDFTPSVTVTPARNLVVGFEVPSYWRTSAADGVYSTDQRLLVRSNAGDGRYVGTNPGILVVWQATRHLQAQGAITRFLAGGFLRDTFVAPGFGFYSMSGVYRF